MAEKKEVWSAFVFILMFSIAIYLHFALPDQKMIVHWDENGIPDGYGSKFMGLFFLPILTLFLYIVFTYMPKIAVFRQNIEAFRTHYIGFKLAFVLYMTFIYIALLMPNIGIYVDMSFLIIFALASFIFYIGYVLKFTKLNYFFGVRTPWTLISPTVWERTNKLGSILFRLVAFFIFFSIFFKDYFLVAILVPVIIAIIFLFIFSYYEYKKEERNGKLVLINPAKERNQQRKIRKRSVKPKAKRAQKRKLVKRPSKKPKNSTKKKSKKNRNRKYRL